MTPAGYKEARTRQLLLHQVETYEVRWIADHKGRYKLGTTITLDGRVYRVFGSMGLFIKERKGGGCR